MSVWKLYLLVLSLTAVSFGGGSTLQAGLERSLVPTRIISPADFAAGIALGQSTPGPLAAFTTAIGRSVLGTPGAVVATLGLITVSLAAVLVLRVVPPAWFKLAPVRGGIAAISPFVAAVVLSLTQKTVLAGNSSQWLGPAFIGGAVFAGRMAKLPTAPLMIGAVVAGMLLQGSWLVGW